MSALKMIGSTGSRLKTWRTTLPKPLSRFRKLVVAVLTLALFFSSGIFLLRSSQATNPSRTYLAFGPVDYVRERGRPVPVTNNFNVGRPGVDYLLRIYNGGRNNQYRTTSRAAVWLNGVKIVRARDFNHTCNDRDDDDDRDDERDDNNTQHNVRIIEKRVTLAAGNTLVVKLRGARGSGLTLEIVGTDRDLPTISAAIAPVPNAAGWNNTSATVNFTCADLTSGIAVCPTPVTVTSEGVNQGVSGTASDRAGNTASVRVKLNIDKTRPAISITTLANGAILTTPDITIGGTITDGLSGVAGVSCNGNAATVSGSNFSCALHLLAGTNTIAAQATDRAGNVNSSIISVTLNTGNTVPDVSGLTHVGALNSLGSAQLVAGTLSEANSDAVPAGRVLSQTPAAGAAATAGSAVNLVLSLGRAGATPPLSFSVDPSVTPASAEVTRLPDGGPRPVVSLVDESGIHTDFVSNELLVSTNDQNALNAFVARWQGQILLTLDPARARLSGLSRMYLVRINTDLVNPAAMVANLRALTANGQGSHRVTNDAGLRTLAAAAMENAGGLSVVVNWLLQSDDFIDRTTPEDPSIAFRGPGNSQTNGADFSDVDYGNNSFNWPYLKTVSLQNIGVDEAWRALAQTGKLTNRVKVLVIDSGFKTTLQNGSRIPDLAASASLWGQTDQAGPGDCNDIPCPWHGTGVFESGFAVPDNNFGVAGPGGPVTDPILLGTPSWDLADIVDFMIGTLAQLVEQPSIINISAGGRIPAVFAGITEPFTNGFFGALRGVGILVFASAGNSSRDVDQDQCFIACWETGSYVPCESSDVICVGGLDWNSRERARNTPVGEPGRGESGSNYGSDPGDCCTVDIFAPYTVWTNTDAFTGNRGIHLASGTSYSSPFMAGVAALVWAANPDLSANDVEDVLMRTSRTDNTDPTVPRRVDAHEAVLAALPNAPPVVTVSVQPRVLCPDSADEICVSRGTDLSFFASARDREDSLNVPVVWTSNLDGVIFTGRSFVKNDLALGSHTLTATATDSGGVSDSESIRVRVINDQAPTLTINSPLDRAVFQQDQSISLSGTSHDANNPPAFTLSETEVSWRLDNSPTPLTSGHGASIPAGTIGPGVHMLTFTGFDGLFNAADLISIRIQPTSPPPGQPPIVSITSPQDGALFVPADVGNQTFAIDLTLTGQANDPEDGALPDSSFIWSDSINAGPPTTLGSGSSLSTRLFTDGLTPETTHAITLDVTDRDGNVSSATVQVRLLFQDSDGDGLTFDEELTHGTDPTRTDSDNDGVWDGAEVFLASDPTSNTSVPRDIPAGTLLGSSSDVRSGAALTLVNPSNGSFGVLGRPNGGLGFGLAFDGNGALYLALGSQLVTVNPLNGTTTPVGALRTAPGESVASLQIAFNPADGMLYGVEEGRAPNFLPTGQLLRINSATAEVTRVGAGSGNPAIHALAFTRIGTLFASVENDASTDRLVELSSATAMITREIGSAAPTTFGLAIDRSGRLLASHRISNELSNLLTLNPASGAATTLTTVARALFGVTIKSCGVPCFELTQNSPLSVPAGDDLAAGDLNGDQNPDVVTSSGSVLIGNGDGTFQVGTSWGSAANSVTLSDLNGDGRLDVVAADAANNNVLVLLGNGNGTFQGARSFAAGSFPVQVEVGDFNGDQIPDLVVATSGGTGIAVLTGSGNGTFQVRSFALAATISAIAVADWNGDSHLDVAAVGAPTLFSGSNGVFTPMMILRGNGQGDLLLAQSFNFGGPAGGPETRQGTIALADMTGDQVPDIITANFQGFSPFFGGATGSVAVMRNMVYGFSPSTAGFFVSETPFVGVSIADVNGDGKPDAIAVTPVQIGSGTTLGHLAVFLGNGNGTLQSPRHFVAGPSEDARAVVLVDLDRDGDLDAVTANGFGAPDGVSVLLSNDSFGRYTPF